MVNREGGIRVEGRIGGGGEGLVRRGRGKVKEVGEGLTSYLLYVQVIPHSCTASGQAPWGAIQCGKKAHAKQD